MNSRQSAWPHYTIAAAFVVSPFYEILVNNLLPVRLGDPRWRVAAFGLLSASLLLISVGLMIAYWLSNAFEHRRFQVVLGACACGLAGILVVLIALFALDSIQLRGGVSREAIRPFYAATSVAALRAIACSIAIAGLGIASFRAGFASTGRPARTARRVTIGAAGVMQGGALGTQRAEQAQTPG